jgi:hypothetical protein
VPHIGGENDQRKSSTDCSRAGDEVPRIGDARLARRFDSSLVHWDTESRTGSHLGTELSAVAVHRMRRTEPAGDGRLPRANRKHGMRPSGRRQPVEVTWPPSQTSSTPPAGGGWQRDGTSPCGCQRSSVATGGRAPAHAAVGSSAQMQSTAQAVSGLESRRPTRSVLPA